jgi:Kef-type K+ transport system membrane component KefB
MTVFSFASPAYVLASLAGPGAFLFNFLPPMTAQQYLDFRICLQLFLLLLVSMLSFVICVNRRHEIPSVAGQILFGVLLGESGLNWLPDVNSPVFIMWSTLGFAMLMCLLGKNLPLRDPNFKKSVGRGSKATILSYLFAVPVGMLVARITHFSSVGVLVLLCACSSTSTVLRVLEERKLSGSGLMVTTTWIPLADVSTLVLLPLVMTKGKWSTAVVGSVVITVVAFALVGALKKFEDSDLAKHRHEVSKERVAGLSQLIYTTVLLGLVALAKLFGVSAIVPGFVTGGMATVVGVPPKFTKRLKLIAEVLFVPPFFVLLGAKLDVRALFHSPHNLWLAVLLTLGSLVVHVVVAKTMRLPLSAGFMASTSMGLPAAVAATGLAEHMVQPGQAAAIVASALLSLGCLAIGVSIFTKREGNMFVTGDQPLKLPADPPDEGDGNEN